MEGNVFMTQINLRVDDEEKIIISHSMQDNSKATSIEDFAKELGINYNEL